MTSQDSCDNSKDKDSDSDRLLSEALDRQRHLIFNEFVSRFGSNLKHTPPRDHFDFKQEGLCKQFNFNCDRIDKLSELESNLDCGNFEAAQGLIKEERQQFVQRNKLLKIADTHGWDTVKKYSVDPLADDNDDASKLRAAINSARISRRSKPYFTPFQGLRPAFKSSQASVQFSRNVQPFLAVQARAGEPLQAENAGNNSARISQGPTCFSCHLPGHFTRDCLYMYRQVLPQQQFWNQQSAASTTSPSSSGDSKQE